MKDKEIKERYDKIIQILKFNTRLDEKPTILKIESIENEFDEYNKKIIKDKVELGTSILLGLIITSFGVAIFFNDTETIHQEIVKALNVIGFTGLGLIPIPTKIHDYRKDRFLSRATANKNLEEYEKFITEVDTEEKINVKKR